MAVAPPSLFFITVIITTAATATVIITLPVAHSLSETEALLNLKNSFSNAEALETWVAGSVPCTEDDQWEGVFCYNGIVTGLRLEKLGLLGEIDVDALLELKGLRTLSFMSNEFSGSIPQLNRIGFLKAVYLSGNKFSGEIPQDFFKGMGSLKKLWLSDNQFTGKIPESLIEAPQLMELYLENNQFSGAIPDLKNPALVKLNFSNNNLEGEVPAGMMRFGESSFQGNSGLCGGGFGSCEKPKESAASSPPVAAPSNAQPINHVSEEGKSWTGLFEIAGIVVASVALVALVVVFIVKSRKKKEEEFDIIGHHHQGNNNSNQGGLQVQVTAPVKRDADSGRKVSSGRRASSSSFHSVKGVGEVVMVNEEKGIFGLPDLMKAAAEVLGNGGFGSSYKAVMANGVAVVVKRTREMNLLGKDDFDAEIRKLAKLKHWNILAPLAFHYRKDEKLVISEYVPRGSLLYLLHGDRGPSHAELDWPARLKIVGGIADGMHYLHTELASFDLPHGNLKSSNILLGPDYEPLLVDYGFINLVNPSNVPQALFAYKAPEAAQHGQVSPKCDVYCFGVVILEILTGKFPSQYLSNGKGGIDVVQWVASAISEGREAELLDPEIANSKNSMGEMEKLLHIGAACTESDPQKRLDMEEAVRRVEEIKGKGGQESRTIEVDGYAGSQVFDNNEGPGDQSRRRHESNSFGSQGKPEFGLS